MSKLENIKDYAERQQEVLKSIRRDGFNSVIGGNETFEQWVEYELEYLLEMIEDL